MHGVFTLSLNNLSLRMKNKRHTKAFECLFFGNCTCWHAISNFETNIKQTSGFSHSSGMSLHLKLNKISWFLPLFSPLLTFNKTDSILRRTLSFVPKGVCLREI